jgi:hypothetical protein
VDDDFNPRADLSESAGDFGDFYSAVSTEPPTSKTDDDFADFHSAFSDQTSSLPASMPTPAPASSGE